MPNDQQGERWSRTAPEPPPASLNIQTAGDGRETQVTRPESVERRGGNVAGGDQEQFLNHWRARADAISTSNSRQEGGHLQDSMYRYANDRLRALGLDKQGWELLPSQMGSPLDRIGCDLVLHNRRTGDMEMLDPTSMRLNPRTGEHVSAGEGGYANAPRIREAGVIDALPGWFDSSGALRRDHDDLSMRAKIEDFAHDFDAQLKGLTDPGAPHPFNMREFPLPSPVVGSDKARDIAEIKTVVDWSREKSGQSGATGDRRGFVDYRDFAKIIETGALAYSSRIDAKPLNDNVDKMAERIILEDAIKALRGSKPVPGEVPPSTALRQNTKDGSNIQVRADGTMVMTLRSSENPGQSEIYNGGNVFQSFEKAARRLASATTNKQVQAELIRTLPKSTRALFETGKLDMAQVLQTVARFRNEYGAGGAGQERTLVGHLVNKYAQRSTSDLKSLATGTQAGGAATSPPPEDERPAVDSREQQRFSGQELTRRTAVNGDASTGTAPVSKPVSKPEPVTQQEVVTKPAAVTKPQPVAKTEIVVKPQPVAKAEATIPVNPVKGSNGTAGGEGNRQRTGSRQETVRSFSELGAQWAQRQRQGASTGGESAPEPVKAAEAEAPHPPAKAPEGGKWAHREAPTPEKTQAGKPVEFVPLTTQEVQRLDQIRASISQKGKLSTDEVEIIKTIDRAKTELTKPAQGEMVPHLAARVGNLRRALGMEGAGTLASVAVVSTILLQVYRDKSSPDDGRRAVFGPSW